MHHLGGPFVLFDNGETLRERILQSAAKLFAIKGYENVSMKHVVECSGVSSRQIYNLYRDKQDLLSAVLIKCSEMLQTFYSALERESKNVATIREALNIIFVELIDITNEFTYYGLCAACQLQFTHELARRVYCQEYLLLGVRTIKHVLDQAVNRGLCGSFDTQAAASLISSSVLVGNDVRAGQLGGYSQVMDLASWYTAQMELLLRLIPGSDCSVPDSTNPIQ